MAFHTDFPIAAGDTRWIQQCNCLRYALIERAAAAGASITPPDIIAKGSELYSTFRPWLIAMRTALEAVLAEEFFLAWDQGPPMQWVPWTKAALLGTTYGWVDRAFPMYRRNWKAVTVEGDEQSGTLLPVPADAGTVTLRFGNVHVIDDGAGGWINHGGTNLPTGGGLNYATGAWTLTLTSAVPAGVPIKQRWGYSTLAVGKWYPFDAPGRQNRFQVGYVNQLYYALMCLRYAELSIGTHSETSASSFYDNHVSEEGGDPVWWGPDTWGQCVAGANQSDTTQYGDITPNTFQMTLGDYMGGVDPWIWVADDGGGGLVKIAGNIGLVGGALDYDTGEWDVQVDTAMVAGYDTQQYYLYTPAASYECVLSIDNGGGSITLPKACVNVFLPVQRHRSGTGYAPEAFAFTTPAAGVYRMFAPLSDPGNSTYTDKQWYELPTITQEVDEVLAHACRVWSEIGAGDEPGASAAAAYAAALAESGITSEPEGWQGGPEAAMISESGVRLDVGMAVIGDLHFDHKAGAVYDLSEFRQS